MVVAVFSSKVVGSSSSWNNVLKIKDQAAAEEEEVEEVDYC